MKNSRIRITFLIIFSLLLALSSFAEGKKDPIGTVIHTEQGTFTLIGYDSEGQPTWEGKKRASIKMVKKAPSFNSKKRKVSPRRFFK